MAKRIYFCPRCLSPNVKKDIKLSVLFGVPQQWKCNDCGLKGHLFPEIDVEDYLRERGKEKKKKSLKASKK